MFHKSPAPIERFSDKKNPAHARIIRRSSKNEFFKATFRYIFKFHFATIIGFVIGCIIHSIHSETNPLSNILTSLNLYIICFLLAFGGQFVSWIFSDKGTFFEIRSRILGFISDYVFMVLATLSTVGTLFLLNTFIFA